MIASSLVYTAGSFSFFKYHAAHQDLHSFPTRRSSDLRMRSDRLPPLTERTIVCIQAGNVNTGAFDPAEEICAVAKRSEEHTSELQSPYDLVCRLLLEKKKIYSLCVIL